MDSEHASADQSVLEAFEVGRAADPAHDDWVEVATSARSQSALVEHMGDLGIDILGEQYVHLPTDVIGDIVVGDDCSGHTLSIRRGRYPIWGQVQPLTHVSTDTSRVFELIFPFPNTNRSFAKLAW